MPSELALKHGRAYTRHSGGADAVLKVLRELYTLRLRGKTSDDVVAMAERVYRDEYEKMQLHLDYYSGNAREGELVWVE